ncbi:MAG: nucleotidyltransferase, partial [Clostridia bacterium]
MGSRYGGEKQLDSIGENGEIILDYSVFDAKRAGFDRILLLIKKENYDVFKQKVGSRFEGKIKVDYAFQNIDDFVLDKNIIGDRKKPWGTGH